MLTHCRILCCSLGFIGGLLVGGTDPWGRHPAAVAQDKIAPEARLKALKITLPEVAKPTNTLLSAVRVGDMLYVSGTGPNIVKGRTWKGRLGSDLDVAKGKMAARDVGLNILAVVKQELGSLDKVVRLVKTLGMVNCTPDFAQQPTVINGFSDLMVEVFGPEMGKGARSAVAWRRCREAFRSKSRRFSRCGREVCYGRRPWPARQIARSRRLEGGG